MFAVASCCAILKSVELLGISFGGGGVGGGVVVVIESGRPITFTSISLLLEDEERIFLSFFLDVFELFEHLDPLELPLLPLPLTFLVSLALEVLELFEALELPLALIPLPLKDSSSIATSFSFNSPFSISELSAMSTSIGLINPLPFL